ncbi:MAG: hydantoinase B/oxoprolinase family protein, partial [Chloroflexota bacterium]|nr:hydantoinase B/oxoprolinase family protein [Chloroflexota bacterium]
MSVSQVAVGTDPARDLVTQTVLYNRLVGVCREMGTTMMRTAYSPIFSESRDFSCVLFDREGRMLAQTEFCPAQVGAIRFVVKWLIAELGDDAVKPGDVIVHNDPYRGGVHMPEHVVIKPVYYEGELFGYVANIAHLVEIGGMAVGGFAATATEVYQEGLRLPPVWLMREGEYNHDVWRVIMSNHRAPRYSWGDLHAMIASLTVAERRCHELLDEFGLETVRQVSSALMDHAERWMRNEIRSIPDGEYEFADHMEDARDPPARDWIRLRLIVDDGEIVADFTESDPQAAHVLNCTYGVTASGVYNAIFHFADNDVPHNDGAYRPITVIARPGSIVNVIHPGASVGGNTETHPRIWGIVMGSLAQAVPERVSAATGGTSCNFLFGGTHPDTGHYYVHYHFDGVGWGGRAAADGNSHQVVPNGNCPATPVEIFETRYPFMARAYRLRTDSGGAGAQRGGLGSDRILEVRAPSITVSALFDRMVSRPWGLYGGHTGDSSRLLVRTAGTPTFQTFGEAFGTTSNSRIANIELREGDEVLIGSPGGGGYGAPELRDPEHVVRDVNEGFVSMAAARDVYRVAIKEVDGRCSVDPGGTSTLRAGPSEVPSTSGATSKPTAAESADRPPAGGRWERLSGDWWQTDVTNCEFCGQVI